MRTTGTPTTARKRAKSQTPATKLLSHLSVPKLKSTAEAAAAAAPPSATNSTSQLPEIENTSSHGKENQQHSTNAALSALVAVKANQSQPACKHRLASQHASKANQSLQECRSHQHATTACADPALPSGTGQHNRPEHIAASAVREAPADGAARSRQTCKAEASMQHAHLATLAAAGSDGPEADVPLACQTAINKRRRPANQARYGEWYNGDDSDLDEHLLNYNAEQADAAQTVHCSDRRKSALPSVSVVHDEPSDGDVTARTKMTSRVRRSTIAPGQDTPAEVAAMTAELNQLAEEMLPEGTETSSDQHRKQETSLRQRLLDSWDGKSYYERLRSEAEAESSPSDAHEEPVKPLGQGKTAARGKPSRVVSAPKSAPTATMASKRVYTPRPAKGRPDAQAQERHRQQAMMSPELLGTSETPQDGTMQAQVADIVPDQATSPTLTAATALTGCGHHHSSPSAMQGPVCSHASAGGQKAHPSDQGVHPTGAGQRQQQNLHAKQAQHAQQSKPGFPSGRTGTQQTVRVHKPPKGPALPPHHAQRTPRHTPRGTAKAQAGQQGSQAQAAGIDHHMQQAEKSGPAQESRAAADHSSTVRAAALQPQPPLAVQPFKAGRMPMEASTSQTAAEGAAQGCHINVHQHQQNVAGKPMGGSGAGSAEQQRQLACLTSNNTALLAELVELQAAKQAQDDYMSLETNLRQSAEAAASALQLELQVEREQRLAAEAKVNQLQQALDSALCQDRPQSCATKDSSAVSKLAIAKQHATALMQAAAELHQALC